MEQPVRILERLLVERGIDPTTRGEDIGFLHMSHSGTFKGQAQADAESTSVEFWLRHDPRGEDGKAELQAKLERVNQNPIMMESSGRWMRFLYTKDHLGFVGRLNQKGAPLDEEVARLRLGSLIELMESKLPGLTT